MKRLAAALEYKVPPPLIGALCAILMWLICGMPPLTGRPPLLLVPALALVVLGLTVDAAGVLSFRRARTTVNPFAPERTVNIVSSGIYRLSRNPMYLGMACILTGWAVWLWQVIGFNPVGRACCVQISRNCTHSSLGESASDSISKKKN